MHLGIGLGVTRLGRSGNPFASLMSTLLSGASQLIAHPLEYGSMFQDRAGTTPVTEPGQLVGHVLDAGPGGYHATAISDAARGVFREVGGLRYIEYNGVNTAYSTPALPAPGVDKVQVFAGVRKLSDAASGIILSYSEASNKFYLANLNTSRFQWWHKSPTNGDFKGELRPSPTSVVLTSLHDFGATTWEAALVPRVNGAVEIGSYAGGIPTGDVIGSEQIYYGSWASSVFFSGRHYATLGPIVRFSAANATAEQIAAAEAYYTARVI